MNIPRILLVEDDVPVANYMKEVLTRKLDCELIEAGSGDIAVEQMTNGEFDLVLLDINMPVMNGLEVLRLVKEVKPLPDVMMVTAYDNEAMIKEAFALGAVDYLPKPVELSVFLNKIKRVLEKKGKFTPQ